MELCKGTQMDFQFQNLGYSFTKTYEINGIFLSFFEIGGQSKIRVLWTSYLMEEGGIVFVIDSTDILSYAHMTPSHDDAIREVFSNYKIEGSNQIESIIKSYFSKEEDLFFWKDFRYIMENLEKAKQYKQYRENLVSFWLNKRDIPGGMSPEYFRSLVADKVPEFHLIECSATEGFGIQEGLSWFRQKFKKQK